MMGSSVGTGHATIGPAESCLPSQADFGRSHVWWPRKSTRLTLWAVAARRC